MKACTVFVASAVVAMVSIESVVGLATYLTEIPNGSNFAKTLGHTDSGYTDFGTAFSTAGATWTADFCAANFPGTEITNGAAFGDPCCTWVKGGTPDKTITVWTDKPTIATECASATTTAPPASSSSAPSSGSASSSDTPSVAPSTSSDSSSSSSSSSTPAPATPSADSSTDSSASSATPAPASSGSSSKAPSKKNSSKCKVKEDKESSDDEDDDDN